jgi:hypothetical protein
MAVTAGAPESTRFLSRHTEWLPRFGVPGGYRPLRLLARLAPALADPAVAGLHPVHVQPGAADAGMAAAAARARLLNLDCRLVTARQLWAWDRPGAGVTRITRPRTFCIHVRFGNAAIACMWKLTPVREMRRV